MEALSPRCKEEGGTMGKEKANSPSRTGSHANGTPLKKPPCSESTPQRGLLSSLWPGWGFNLLSPRTHTRSNTPAPKIQHEHRLTQFRPLSPSTPTLTPPSIPTSLSSLAWQRARRIISTVIIIIPTTVAEKAIFLLEKMPIAEELKKAKKKHALQKTCALLKC